MTAENLGYALRIPLGDEAEHVRAVLNIPAEYVMPCYVAIGKPAEEVVLPEQKEHSLEAVIHINRW